MKTLLHIGNQGWFLLPAIAVVWIGFTGSGCHREPPYDPSASSTNQVVVRDDANIISNIPPRSGFIVSNTNLDNQTNESTAHPPGTVFFDNAHVLLVPDSQWDEITNGTLTEAQDLSLPVLEGIGDKRGMVIQVFVHGGDTNLDKYVERMESLVSHNTNLIQEKLQKDGFTANRGIKGTKMTFDYKVQDSAAIGTFTSHAYLFLNEMNECVVLNCFGPSGPNFEAVDRSILDTLDNF